MVLQVFGLHPNADITYQTNLANDTLSTIINIQPKAGGGGAGETREASVQRLATEMLEKLPPDYVPHEVSEGLESFHTTMTGPDVKQHFFVLKVKSQLQKMGPFQPMNIFLRQEVDRMQRVISTVRSTLSDLNLAIDGRSQRSHANTQCVRRLTGGVGRRRHHHHVGGPPRCFGLHV